MKRVFFAFLGFWLLACGHAGPRPESFYGFVSASQAGGMAPGGRLTLTSGTSVTTLDVVGATTIYYAQHAHGLVPIEDGAGGCKLRPFTEVSQVLSGLTTGKNYDDFVSWSGSAVALQKSAAWATDTTRTDALVQSTVCIGVWVKSSDHTQTWLGVFRATDTNKTEDSRAKRYVYNYYNREPRPLFRSESTNSWASDTAYRPANNDANNSIAYVAGDASLFVSVRVQGLATANVGVTNVSVGIGVDSTTVNSAVVFGANATVTFATQVSAEYRGSPGLGWHVLTWLDIANAASTFYGDAGLPTFFQTGLVGVVWQ